jgi:predicted nucleic acid-binding protein
MPEGLYYLDASAYLKLVVAEPESRALRSWVRAQDANVFASEILRVEALRTARRHSPEALLEARERLDAITLLAVTSDICERASELDPGILRSLDAIHLATALSAGDRLQGALSSDQRLSAACVAHGVRVIAPGQ